MVNTTLFWMQTSLRKKALQVNRKALGVNKKVPWPCIHTSSDASRVGSNWVKICSSDLRQTLARTLSLPLCGIPMMILSTPNSLDLSMIVFIAGINTSQPSMPKRFSDDHFLARKASNLQYMKKKWEIKFNHLASQHNNNNNNNISIKTNNVSCILYFTLSPCLLNPLTPMSDQDRISLYNFNAISTR